jgi:hypothetical protein
MVKVLLTDPALAPLLPRFAERLPGDVEMAAVSGFADEEFARLAADARILVNARRPLGSAALAMAPEARLIQSIGWASTRSTWRPPRPRASRWPTTRASTAPARRSTRSC